MKSDDDEILAKTLNALGLGPTINEAYRDMLQPTCRVIGKELLVVGRAVSAALAPLRGAVWGIEQIQEWLAVTLTKKLASVPEKSIQTPSLTIAGPTLVQLVFCRDQAELQEMYANLLASAMDSRSAAGVHTAFVHIINQLSPDEARILDWVAPKGRRFWPVAHERLEDGVRPQKDSDWLLAQFEKICRSAGVRQIENADLYLSNLVRLGLLEIRSWSDAKYVPEHADHWGSYDPSVAQEFNTELTVSALGIRFLEMCVAKQTA